MDKTIVSLAIIKVNWDTLKRDYIENFVPFIGTLFAIKDYKEVEVNTVCDDFKTEFGIIIPYHAMCTILTRCQKRGLIKKSALKFVPVKEKLIEFEFSQIDLQQLRMRQNVVDTFIAFARDRYNQTLTEEEAESALVCFLKNHDIDILFAAEQSSVLPYTRCPKKTQFLINRFIKHAYESEPLIFSFIRDIAIGHMLVSALLYPVTAGFKGKLRGVDIYLDTRCILRLLDLEDRETTAVYTEFVQTLQEAGANLFIFRHTQDEIVGILQDCLPWIENREYDESQGSPVLRRFVENGCKQSDIDRSIVRLPQDLKERKIEVVDVPLGAEYARHHIDESKLYDFIVKTYKQSGGAFDELEKGSVVQKDVKSIAAINNIRKGRRPKTVSELRSIFVTSNSSLAWANRQFEAAESSKEWAIPCCVTDVFLGTVVWLQSPLKLESINEKKLIAYCYGALRPDDKTIKRYLAEVQRLRAEGRITEDEYYLLRTHRVAINLLEEKTMGDLDSFTPRTAEEILEDIKQQIRKEEEGKYLSEKKKREEDAGKLAATNEAKRKIERNIERRAEQFSGFFAWVIFAFVSCLAVAGWAATAFPAIFGSYKGVVSVLRIPAALFTLLGVTTGFNIKGFRDLIRKFIKRKTVMFLSG